MKRHSKIAVAVLVVSTVGGIGLTAIAASESHEGWHQRSGGHGGSRGTHMLEQFDMDGDGKLTQAEIDQTRQERFTRFDTDGDGALNLDEYEALWIDAMRDRMVDRFQMHDDDGDGQVTQDEFGSRFAGMVERMDRNGDGVIDDSDMRRRHHDNDDD